MSLLLTRELLEATTCDDLVHERTQASRYGKRNLCALAPSDLTDALLADVGARQTKWGTPRPARPPRR